MTWKSHKITSFFLACALGFDLVASFSIALFSIFPDALEKWWPASEHREGSHFWLTYIAFGILSYGFLTAFYYIYAVKIFAIFLFLFAVGSLLHIFEDMFSVSGIPIWPWFSNRKMMIPIYKTKQISEYIVTAIFCVSCFAYILVVQDYNQIKFIYNIVHVSDFFLINFLHNI
jgi:membrane-bound metal-dependent hydrolase YbcI (DUF457 family)